MMRKAFLLAVVGLILFVAPAAFATIILDASGAVSYQQTSNSPCVIGNPSCDNGGFGYTSAPTAPDFSQVTGLTTTGQYDIFSPNGGVYPLGSNLKYDPKNYNAPYLVNSALTGVLAPNEIPATFTIGIDVNYTSVEEALVAFRTYVYDGSGSLTDKSNWVLDTANSWNYGDAGHASPYILEIHNGNGYSDAILTGFSLTNGSQVFFEAFYGNPPNNSDEDGMEQFFIIPAGTPPSTIPEPTTMLLLGAGLVGIGFFARKRDKK